MSENFAQLFEQSKRGLKPRGYEMLPLFHAMLTEVLQIEHH